jgi:hypothetical protein
MLPAMLEFWRFMHIVGVAGFLSTHGVSMYAMFQVRAVEGDRDRIFDLCDLSKRTIPPMYVSTLLLVVGGVAAGISARSFGQAWLWVSIVVLLVTMAAMSSIATPYMKRLRDGCTRWHDGSYILSEEELGSLLVGPTTTIVAVLGTLGLLVILYLMVYRPGV